MLGEFKAPVREMFIKPKSFNFKNRIINGDFSVWQRGTTKTGITAPDYYTADRFHIDLNSGSFKSEKSNILGHNALKISVETPPDLTVAGNYVIPIKYAFEGQHLYDLAIAKKKITISFLFNSNVAGEYAVSFRNTTGGTVNESFIERFIYPKANVPQKVKITIPLDTNFKALANDENIGFVLSIGAVSTSTTLTTGSWLTGNVHSTITATNWTANAGDFIEIAQLQLEEGNVATEFEYIPYDIQLQRCMRYYEVIENAIAWKSPYTNDTYNYITFRVRKRVIPSITFIRPSDGTVGGADYYWINGNAKVGCYVTGAAGASKDGVSFGNSAYAPDSTDDAHLITNIHADAEL